MPEIAYRWRSLGADAVVRDQDRITAARKRAKQADGRGGGASSPAMREERKKALTTQQLAEQVAKAQEKAELRKSRTIERIKSATFANEQRAEERAAKDKVRIAQRSAADIARTQKSHHRDAQRLRREMAAIEHRDLAKAEKEQKAKWDKRMSAIGGGASRAAWGVAGGVAGAGIAAGGVGVAIAGAAVRQRAAARDQAIALSIAGRQYGKEGVSADVLLGDATKTARAVKGTRVADVLTAQSKFVAMTGDLGGARVNSKMFAVAARATGGKEEDIAATAATMKEKFGISDPEEMRDAMATLIQGGKSGAFEMKDAAQYMTEMGAAGQRFGLDKGQGGVATLGGLAQLSMMSAGNGAKASTGTQAMLRQLVAKGGAGKESIKALTGADVFTDKTHTQTRNVQDVLVDVIGGARGDQTKLTKIFGDEGLVGASKLISTYNEAAGKKTGTADEKQAAGKEAVRALLDQTINVASDWNEVVKDAAAATATGSATLESTWETIAAGVGDALLPSLTAFAGNISAIAGPLKSFAEATAIAINSVVALAKWAGVFKEEKPEEPSLTPKADLADATSQLAALDAKEKTLGGLTAADQTKRVELKSKQIELKDQLLSADPSLAGVTSANQVETDGYKPGRGPMRLGKTGLQRIMDGEDVESRDFVKQQWAKGPQGIEGQYENEGKLDSFLSFVGGAALGIGDFVGADKIPGLQNSGVGQDAEATADRTADYRRQAVAGGMSPITAASLDTAGLIAALNANTEATRASSQVAVPGGTKS